MKLRARSRGTPRVANRLLRRVRDYAQIKGNGMIDKTIADQALALLVVDHCGFDTMDQKLLLAIINKFDGGPVGLDSLAASIGEVRETDRGCNRAVFNTAGLYDANSAWACRNEFSVSAFWIEAKKQRIIILRSRS